ILKMIVHEAMRVECRHYPLERRMLAGRRMEAGPVWPVLNFLSHAWERQIPSILRWQMPAEGMSTSVGQRLWPSLAVIFILWLAIFVPGLPQPSLFDDADGAHAEAGREILTLHDYVTLHENGIRYLEKAPLPYWAMAVSFRLFGVSEP